MFRFALFCFGLAWFSMRGARSEQRRLLFKLRFALLCFGLAWFSMVLQRRIRGNRFGKLVLKLLVYLLSEACFPQKVCSNPSLMVLMVPNGN